MPEGSPSRLTPDTQQLLRLMSMRSEIIERGLAGRPRPEPDAIEELPPAAPSILDQLVLARVETEAESLAVALPSEEPLPESASELEALADQIDALDAALEHIAELAPEEPELDLLELNAAEAGQPAEILPLDADEEDELDSAEEPPSHDQPLEYAVEHDALLAQPVAAIEEASVLIEDMPASDDDLAPLLEGEQPAEVEAIEGLPLVEGEEEEPRSALDEGPGEDFQALLAGARESPTERAGAADDYEDEEGVPLVPADADVRLRARNGPKPGAEFVGKSTLAGATGLYCLIERFNLPEGTRMKITLTAPRFTERFEIQDAVVTRVRRAPGNSTEVQLAFDEPHAEFEEFVTRHFGDKPVGFTLFSRRRPKPR